MKFTLTEMALSRPDAITRCTGLGKRFIEHYVKIYNDSSNEAVHHWSQEMQGCYTDISDVVLKNNNKHLNISQKIDWFYSFGSSYEEYFNYSDDMIDKYEELIDKVEHYNYSIYSAINMIFNL